MKTYYPACLLSPIPATESRVASLEATKSANDIVHLLVTSFIKVLHMDEVPRMISFFRNVRISSFNSMICAGIPSKSITVGHSECMLSSFSMGNHNSSLMAWQTSRLRTRGIPLSLPFRMFESCLNIDPKCSLRGAWSTSMHLSSGHHTTVALVI